MSVTKISANQNKTIILLSTANADVSYNLNLYNVLIYLFFKN